MDKLSTEDLIKLIQSVFPNHPDDRWMGILVDIPRDPGIDNAGWKQRRSLAEDWFRSLKNDFSKIVPGGVKLIAYPNVGSNNADLPQEASLIKDRLPSTANLLEETGQLTSFEKVFKETQLFLALTEFSATAPLKNAAKKFKFRAATMPGFSSRMIPALKIDYNDVNRRVLILKDKLDSAVGAEVNFEVDGKDEYRMNFDLRFRMAHASSGRFPEKGTAGNLPSGEAYIVPYEGEKGEPSQTAGILPVQIQDSIVLFSVKENKAYESIGTDQSVKEENDHLKREPAYGNMAELGFGVLADFGLQPIGSILLDEKLGFHVAFGRSEHFGGAVGPGDFSNPDEVIHLDRIYIPATQPRITVRSIELNYANGKTETILENGKYLIF